MTHRNYGTRPQPRHLPPGSAYREQDYRTLRQRPDRLYVPLEPSPPVFKAWAPHIAAGVLLVAMIALLIFP